MLLQTCTIPKHIRKLEETGNAHQHLDSGSAALHWGGDKRPIIWIIWKFFPSFILLTKEVTLQLRPRAG